VGPDELVGIRPQLSPAPTAVLLFGRLPGSTMHHGGRKYYKATLLLEHYDSHITHHFIQILVFPVAVKRGRGWFKSSEYWPAYVIYRWRNRWVLQDRRNDYHVEWLWKTIIKNSCSAINILYKIKQNFLWAQVPRHQSEQQAWKYSYKQF
jgi:hypothetical protein